MVILDRVFCDICGCHVGQLFNLPAVSPGIILDMAVPPYFMVCPVCHDLSVTVETNQHFENLGCR